MARRDRRTAHRRGAEGGGMVGELVSFLERHGYTAPVSEHTITESSIISRVARGAIPIAHLAALAEGCGFETLLAVTDAARSATERGDVGRARGGTPPGEARAAGAEAIDLEDAFALVFGSLGEVREGQLEMARAVWRALEADGVALLEAGTGTGKSLAYLVPSVLYSLRTGERVIVSTYTKILQDQLFRREVRALEEALSVDIRAERLLGRDNYLCTRNVIAHGSELGGAANEPALALALSVSLSDTGTIDSLGALPDGVSAARLAAPERCPMNACGFAERCPLIRSRSRAREANVLFVNHALLFTDYRQGGSVIGPYARVVFDEAHHLERCIIENLSVKASREDVNRALEPLRLSGREDAAWKLLEHELASSSPAPRGGLRRELSRRSRDLEAAYEELFRGIGESLNPGGARRSMRCRYMDGGATFASSRKAFNDISFNIRQFTDSLKLIDDVKLPQDLLAFQQEISYAREELATLSDALAYLSAGQDEDAVFWLDWDREGSLREMCGSPLAVDRSFADYLDGFLGTAVFTSATLSQNGSFAFIKERLGFRLLAAKPIELIIPSPFPFDENCLVLAVSGLGDPNGEDFAAPVSEIVSGLAALVARRTMVLFTSYRLCLSVAASLAARNLERPLFVQGAGESREVLSERFRRHESGVLLGVASFWEGVDFPGEELEVLVIPKIPFPVPTEPIVEARAQRLSALGEDPFEKLFLPEAILRMRQGAGRLIRRMDDRGVIVILDDRLGVRPYARTVLSSLPSRNIEHVSIDECVERAARWFDGS